MRRAVWANLEGRGLPRFSDGQRHAVPELSNAEKLSLFLPGTFDTPEQRVGRFQADRPWESCCTLGTQWAWKPNDTIKSFEQCVQMLVGCATVPAGQRDPLDTIVKLQFDRSLEGIEPVRAGPKPMAPDGRATTFSRLGISEAYDRIGRFELQIQSSPMWETVSRGTTVGEDFVADFPPVPARHVRLNVLEATDVLRLAPVWCTNGTLDGI